MYEKELLDIIRGDDRENFAVVNFEGIEIYPSESYDVVKMEEPVEEVKEELKPVEEEKVDDSKVMTWKDIMDIKDADTQTKSARQYVIDHMNVVPFDSSKHARPEDFGAKADGITDDGPAFVKMRSVTKDIYLTAGKYYRVNLDKTIFNSGKKFVGNGANLVLHFMNKSTALFGSMSGTYDFDSVRVLGIIEKGDAAVTPDKMESQYKSIGHNVCLQNSFLWVQKAKLNRCVVEILEPAPTKFERADKEGWMMYAERINLIVGYDVEVTNSYIYNVSRCSTGGTIWGEGPNSKVVVKDSLVYGIHDDEVLCNYGNGKMESHYENMILYTTSKMKQSSGTNSSGKSVDWSQDTVMKNCHVHYMEGRREGSNEKPCGIDVGYWSKNSLTMEGCSFDGDIQQFIFTSGYTGTPSTIKIRNCDFSGLTTWGWKSSVKNGGYLVQNTKSKYGKDIYTIDIDEKSKASFTGGKFH